jgi:uridine kinase
MTEIDKRLKKGSIRLAIEGGSACGKTTLSSILAEVYKCPVLHIDDFFLRPEQRTAERFAEAGGNFDRERFISEVIMPLSQGNVAEYRRFDCSTGTILPPKEIRPEPLIVVEGAYSMHPELQGFYDLSVFLEIAPDKQRRRIIKRNSQALAERFFNEWIPLELKYFKEFDIPNKCAVRMSFGD